MILLTSVILCQGLYQCVATNNVGTHNAFVAVVVIKRTKVRYRDTGRSELDNIDPLRFQVSIVADDGPQEISIQAGQKLKLPCKVDNDERNRSV